MHSNKKKQAKFVWWLYVVALALIFPLFLYANNLGQVTLDDLWRPALFSALFGLLLFGVVYLIIRDSGKAGLITVLVEIFVFSYCHI
jgi:RsiW-degrading membrane proteinase PrsW (M82 family)